MEVYLNIMKMYCKELSMLCMNMDKKGIENLKNNIYELYLDTSEHLPTILLQQFYMISNELYHSTLLISKSALDKYYVSEINHVLKECMIIASNGIYCLNSSYRSDIYMSELEVYKDLLDDKYREYMNILLCKEYSYKDIIVCYSVYIHYMNIISLCITLIDMLTLC